MSVPRSLAKEWRLRSSPLSRTKSSPFPKEELAKMWRAEPPGDAEECFCVPVSPGDGGRRNTVRV